MKNCLLASTSTVYGSTYLEYLKPEIAKLFEGIDEVLFIPFARPEGLSHDDYTQMAADVFKTLGIHIRGLHSYPHPEEALNNAKGIFVGGGNTFLLVNQLYKHHLIKPLKTKINIGTPYLGTSAGINICGPNMQTTNDMPIVHPSSFDTLGIVPFNFNAHYLDPDPKSTHKGESRITRIKEYHTQNDITVVGLREESFVRLLNGKITLEGPHTAKIFKQGQEPYELASGASLMIL